MASVTAITTKAKEFYRQEWQREPNRRANLVRPLRCAYLRPRGLGRRRGPLLTCPELQLTQRLPAGPGQGTGVLYRSSDCGKELRRGVRNMSA
jgi:hypothetical protein